jgi:tRNA threonylcarbamoyladenosine modification (KEOPS) complex  Pcc1 subunit
MLSVQGVRRALEDTIGDVVEFAGDSIAIVIYPGIVEDHMEGVAIRGHVW